MKVSTGASGPTDIMNYSFLYSLKTTYVAQGVDNVFESFDDNSGSEYKRSQLDCNCWDNDRGRSRTHQQQKAV